jgi:hypothetical protein
MSGFYLNAIGEALTESVVVALVLGALCWLVEFVARHKIGFYAGYVAVFLVAIVVLRFAYIDLKDCSSAFGSPSPWCDIHGWYTKDRLFYFSLMLITIPLLIFSEIKLRRWSLNRAQPTPEEPCPS